ncbi:MAG TPA: GNAT family N-acetyltransferase [Chloroflexia bacterium]|nr:GNAT family N-acetyltransferase [Chloroflexia bacterium]
MLPSQQDPDHDTLMAMALAAAEGFKALSRSAQGRNDVVAGAQCWYCSSAVPVFNGAAILEERLLNPDSLRGIAEYFTSKGRPYSLMTMDALLPYAGGALRGLGYYEYDRMPAMWLDGLPTPRQVGPDGPGLAITRVEDTRDIGTFRAILSRVFHIAPDEAEMVLGDNALAVEGVRHYLGRLDGEAVGTLSVVTSGPVPGIWNVGTLPEHRRAGIGTALMHHALREAANEGRTSSMLLASKEGVPLYELLGYRTLSTVRIFVPG